MPVTYTVKGAALKKDNIQSQHGVFKTLTLLLATEGQAEPVAAEWYTKQETPVPAEGSTLEGEITVDPQWGPKFKKAQQGGFGGGGFRGRSPEENRRIVRQHSQEMAIRWAELAHARGKLPEDFKTDDLLKLVDVFHRDAMEGGT